ncbi:restriction endonuclease subunit S [Tenacibaculum piscium]|uniref:Type I restriction-modification system specificity determinant protein n=1 Tax=Tenacibaculum piscium TaxID=1458515 RepID=A0A2H1YEJ4_9FLAO|nr:restriction endonuclease subunit S [Tenacibaculum piscium]MBE7628406.1 restriction endonuclease subunit S [Tenacibaculum piscium]SOS73919.1 Type I restriction-modification system specificity determinant protein [Tenacibaculum piscium]
MIEYKLKELLEIKNGRDYKHLKKGNIPVYGSGGLMRYVDEYLYKGKSVLLPRKGTLSNIQYVNEAFWTVDTIYYSIVDENKAEPYYLYNYVKLLDLKHLNTGTGVPSMTFGAYYDIPIKLPNLQTQKSIAKVLSDLDSKIAINNKINAALEAMAKTLYDYWFVQFDFPDKNGKPYKSSEGKMIFNEELKREIPVGWEVEALSEIESNIITGKTPSTKKEEFYNGEIPFITIGDVRGNMHITKTVQTLSELGGNQNSNKFLPKGSICVTCIASPGLVGFVTKDSQSNQQINSIICKNDELRFYLYFYLKDYFKFAKASSGSTFSNMNKGDFSAIKTVKPNDKILIDFSKILNPIINKILKNQLENQKLSELRDWLLPMLMNGQVRVGEK